MASQSHVRRPPVSTNSQMVQSSVKSWLENAKRDQQLKANSAIDSTPSSATAATTGVNASKSTAFPSTKTTTATASSATTSTTRPTTSASSSVTSSSSAVRPKMENQHSKAKPTAKPTNSTTTSTTKKSSLKDERKTQSNPTSSVTAKKKEKKEETISKKKEEKEHKSQHKKRRAEEKEVRDSITLATGGSHQHHHHHHHHSHHKHKHHRSKGPAAFAHSPTSPTNPNPTVTTLDLINVKLPTEVVDFDHRMQDIINDSCGEDSDSSLSSVPMEEEEEMDLGFLDSESVVDDLIDGMDTGDNSEDEDSLTLEEYTTMVKRLKNVGMDAWIEEMVMNGFTHFRILKMFNPKMAHIVEGFGGTNNCLPMVKRVLEAELKKRRKLETVNTVDDVVHLLNKSRNIIVLTGAGISTSLGIPDFRSKDNGLYTKLANMGLSDPQEVFDIHVFRDDPSIFYQVAKDILPDTTRFSPTHAFIELLQRKGKLLTNYTQNIDNLEFHAGIEKDKLVQCHGSFATATCVKCGYKVPGQDIFPDLKRGRVAKCEKCIKTAEQANAALKRKRKRTSEGPRKNKRFAEDSSADEDEGNYYDAGVMKPDITFFGEQLPDRFHDRLTQHDHDKCDLLICIGTSLKVAPVSEVNNFLPPHVPQILISKTPVKHVEFDVKLMGSCDDVVAELSRRSGWEPELKHDMIKEGWQVSVVPVEEEIGHPDGQCSTWLFERKEPQSESTKSQSQSQSHDQSQSQNQPQAKLQVDAADEIL